MIDLNAAFGHLSDEAYRELVLSIADSPAASEGFPTFPPESVQAQFVGSAFRSALAEASVFYSHVKAVMAANDERLGVDKKFMDFGCGWGRFIRFFGRDVRAENIIGVDVDPDILKICKATGVPGRLEHIEPLGVLPVPNGSINLATAYSVFTHLPEAVHLHWMKEFARAVAPGGIVALTLEPRRFLDFVEEAPEKGKSQWHLTMAKFAAEAPKLKLRFDAGEFIYLPTGGGAYRPSETYGEAVVPLSYIRSRWSADFEVLEYLDDAKKFWQAVLILRRKSG
jgi:SAM-dependent methyltransferase